MNELTIAIAMVVGLAVYIAYELRRAPKEPFDASLAQDDEARAQECIDASRPAELRPHVKAGTAWGQEQ